jgi:hypothetical protein
MPGQRRHPKPFHSAMQSSDQRPAWEGAHVYQDYLLFYPLRCFLISVYIIDLGQR